MEVSRSTTSISRWYLNFPELSLYIYKKVLLIDVLSCLNLCERPGKDGFDFNEHQVRDFVILRDLLFEGGYFSAQLLYCVFSSAHFVFETSEKFGLVYKTISKALKVLNICLPRDSRDLESFSKLDRLLCNFLIESEKRDFLLLGFRLRLAPGLSTSALERQ